MGFGGAELGSTEFGFYVHVPFCAARCDYCAFATWTDRDHLMAPYAEACVTEARLAVEEEGLPLATSVFFGGGTPSRLDPAMLCSILNALPRTATAEVTVECNPEDASAERFSSWLSAGVTRVSFGAQSMVPKVLKGLGRRHLPGAVEQAVMLAHSAGFASVSVDLIFGGAGETDRDWVESLETVLSFDRPPQHLSCYALTVEPGTPLASDLARHPDDDVQAVRYETADSILDQAGYSWYEVSNWSLPGHECRHNTLYWRQGDYRGIGCAAHSHRQGRRFWNVRTPERYLSAVSSRRPPQAGSEVLDPGARRLEALSLAIRTSAGVPIGAVPDDPDLASLIERRGDRGVLTLRGRLLANEVAIRLEPEVSLVPAGILRE
jgi:putative oxygen-independent coproporphyrinogen III oxidase